MVHEVLGFRESNFGVASLQGTLSMFWVAYGFMKVEALPNIT